jgi:hypothetical protein
MGFMRVDETVRVEVAVELATLAAATPIAGK